MLLNDIKVDHVYIACGRTDMRRSINGLAAIVQSMYHLDPFSRSLFLYKRYENGSLKWPRDENEARELSLQQLRWLLEGLSIDQPKAVKNIDAKYVV